MKLKNITFLYTRLADYFYQSIRYLLAENEDYQVAIVSYPQDENAPFLFQEEERLHIVSAASYTADGLIDWISNQNTVALYVTGWGDTKYLKAAKHFYGKIPTIMGIDNPWEGTLRQRLGVQWYRKKLSAIYSHIWCSGTPQIEFARRLGYDHSKILKGLYAANTPVFEAAYQERQQVYPLNYPKKLLFVGRYVEYKNPLMLVRAFSALVKEGRHNGWSLSLIGAGELKEALKAYENDHISINDFIPPRDLPNQLAEAGAFCLPSQSEHWGVVVHEAVAAGLPLIVSDTVYASTEFLIDGYNGWSFATNNEAALKKALQNLFTQSTDQLVAMSQNSVELSKRITQSYWAANLKSVLSHE